MKGVLLNIVFEDKQQGAFLRRFLELAGWDRRDLYGVPLGNEQQVREEFARVVKEVRKGHRKAAVLAMIDADMGSIDDRVNELEIALEAIGESRRKRGEHFAIIVPKRNIETWLAYLNDEQVDETRVYPRLEHQRDCKARVQKLKKMCDQRSLSEPPPPSLVRACNEYGKRIPHS